MKKSDLYTDKQNESFQAFCFNNHNKNIAVVMRARMILCADIFLHWPITQ
jgi:hypothetical protein